MLKTALAMLLLVGVPSSYASAHRLTVEEQLWVDSHNEVRKSVGTEPLVWSRALQKKAEAWAKELTKDCSKKLILKHSPDRGDIGENIAGSYGRIHPVSLPVKWWAKEEQWYNKNKHKCNAPEGRSCGHYTQVVSKRSKMLGCARAMCSGEGKIAFYVCNYEPHGNMMGVKPF